MKRYIARAPVTVVCDHRPGDSFEAEPADVAHLVDAGHLEVVGRSPETLPAEHHAPPAAGGSTPATGVAGSPGSEAKASAKKASTKKPAK